MGKNNRQHRADKHRQRARTQRRASESSRGFLGRRDLAEVLLFEAAEAAEHGNVEPLDSVLDQLGALGDVVASAMTSHLVTGLRAAWKGGWQPVDIARAAAKRLGRAGAELAAEMITLESRSSGGTHLTDGWASQLRDLARAPRVEKQRWAERDALRDGAALLGMLIHLPVLPRLDAPPAPGERSRRHESPGSAEALADGRILAKVRALLAKAESTEFEEEADALTAKAQQLMARHAIDRAMVVGVADGPEPCGRRIGIDDPYAQAKNSLLSAVAKANRCRTVWMDGYGFSTMVGFANDLDIVEVLFTSLLVQATRAMTASGSVRDGAGRSRTRSYRQSFLIAFAHRIGERLQAATSAATEEATVAHGSRLLPVLAGRSAAVDDALEAMFPDLVTTTSRITNAAGWAAGRAAADMAHLGPDQELPPGVAV